MQAFVKYWSSHNFSVLTEIVITRLTCINFLIVSEINFFITFSNFSRVFHIKWYYCLDDNLTSIERHKPIKILYFIKGYFIYVYFFIQNVTNYMFHIQSNFNWSIHFFSHIWFNAWARLIFSWEVKPKTSYTLHRYVSRIWNRLYDLILKIRQNCGAFVVRRFKKIEKSVWLGEYKRESSD